MTDPRYDVALETGLTSAAAVFATLPAQNVAEWANDDLLLLEPARQILAAAAPRAFRVLDWKMLRAAFEMHDRAANSAKRTLNRHGMRGALLSASGTSLLAFAPLLPGGVAQGMVALVGCAFVVVGGIMGLWHLVGHGGRARWLLARLWTERLRQFYFQHTINHLGAAVEAMDGGIKLEAYQSARDGALRAFIGEIEQNVATRGRPGTVGWLADDHSDAYAWGQSLWQTNLVAPGTRMTDDYRELFECLSRNRIGVQDTYARLNLKPQGASQGHMAHRISMSANVATFVFVVTLTLAGGWILYNRGHGSPVSESMIAASGVAAAWGLYFRLVDQGMGYSFDTERYELYCEQVGLVRQRFDTAADDVYGKVEALRRLELYTYREMRQFLRTHLRSRFLG